MTVEESIILVEILSSTAKSNRKSSVVRSGYSELFCTLKFNVLRTYFSVQ